jgi:hypothetical protein
MTMAFGRQFIIPGRTGGFAWKSMLDFLGPEVACPRCSGRLRQDRCEGVLALADDGGHSFSNVRALVVELYQRGMLRPKVTTLVPGAINTTAA